MKVFATSDLHLSQSTAQWVFEALDEIAAATVAANQADVHTVLVGDIFDQPEMVHMPTYNALRDRLRAWPNGVVHIVVGNHDQYDAPRHALEALASTKTIIWDQPGQSNLGVMVPYQRTDFDKALTYALSRKVASEPDVLWCHQGFKGAYMNSMIRDRDGADWTCIPQGYVVIAGHYHMPQTLGPLIYCGSPWETTFAEEGQRKGYLVITDMSVDRIPVRVPFTRVTAPRHFTVQWDPAVGPPVRPPEARPQDILRVVAKATKQEIASAHKQLADAGLDGVPVIAKPTEVAGRGMLDPSWDLIRAATEYATRASPHLPLREAADDLNLWEGV